jgi:hypothetical protein
MTRPLIARVTRALAGLLALATIASCMSEPPMPQRFTAPPREPMTLVMPGSPRVVPPYSLVPGTPWENQPQRLVPGTPEGDGLCRLGSLRCGEIYPTPGRLCLLSTERCPPDGKFQRLEGAPQSPSR